MKHRKIVRALVVGIALVAAANQESEAQLIPVSCPDALTWGCYRVDSNWLYWAGQSLDYYYGPSKIYPDDYLEECMWFKDAAWDFLNNNSTQISLFDSARLTPTGPKLDGKAWSTGGGMAGLQVNIGSPGSVFFHEIIHLEAWGWDEPVVLGYEEDCHQWNYSDSSDRIHGPLVAERACGSHNPTRLADARAESQSQQEEAALLIA
ncbi:MAG: hypothetical protein ACREMA_10370, partial [Longimicrobiales bacterium]